MRMMEVFSFGMPTYNPDPRHLHDNNNDRARGWWGKDAQGRRHFWRWDRNRHVWY
ncbi:MAG: hypothetical protein WBL53_25145 [Pseudonocardiaceae bacterium]|jgi:hypothetical protein